MRLTFNSGPAFNYYTFGITKTLAPKSMRIYDLTETTDDPGNTELYLVFIPCEYDGQTDQEGLAEIKSKLKTYFSSDGDRHEEITVLTQNNEILIIFNNNK